MIYTVTLAPALDYGMWLDAVCPGGVNRARQTRLRVGGKGVNVSVVLRGLDMPSVCLGFVAGFTGREILRQIRSEGLREQMIELEEGNSRINVKLKSETETEINAEGPAIHDAAMQALLSQIAKLGPGDVLVLSGSVPAGMDETLYARLTHMAKAAGAEAAVDATGGQLLNALAEGPLLVKPNLHELEQAAGTSIRTQEELCAQALELRRRGARNVLVSLGAEGALLACGTGLYICKAPGGTVVDTTGAGDSMVAAYLYACSRRLPDADCLRLCVAAGSASAFSHGLAAREAVFSLLAQTPSSVRIGSCDEARNMA